MADLDIRWRQRLANYRKALAQLDAAVDLAPSRELTELERQGLIQAFEFTHKLAWNVMKDYFASNERVVERYHPLFQAFRARMEELEARQ